MPDDDPLASGLRLRPRDMARIGYLYLGERSRASERAFWRFILQAALSPKGR